MPETPETDSPTYHHGDLRRVLLEVASELVREKGPATISLREISRRAGVSNRAPYHHFDDKMALMAELARQGFRRLHGRFQDLREVKDPGERIVKLGLTYLEFARENPGEFATMYWDDLCNLQNFPDRIEYANGAFPVLLETFEQICGIPLSEDDLRPVALSAWALVHGLATLEAQGLFEIAYPGADARELEHSVVVETRRSLELQLSNLVAAKEAEGAEPPAIKTSAEVVEGGAT